MLARCAGAVDNMLGDAKRRMVSRVKEQNIAANEERLLAEDITGDSDAQTAADPMLLLEDLEDVGDFKYKPRVANTQGGRMEGSSMLQRLEFTIQSLVTINTVYQHVYDLISTLM